MRSPRRASSQAGFALLEVLLSITLAVIILTFITGGFSFGTRVWETSKRVETYQDADLTDRVVSTWLAGAMPVSRYTDGRGSELEFQGDTDDLTFVTLSDGYTQRAGLARVHLGISSAEAGSGDVVAESTIFRRGEALSTSKTVLARGASLELAYYGAVDAASAPTWQREWKHMRTLPILVEFRIKPRSSPLISPTIVRIRTGDVLPRRWSE